MDDKMLHEYRREPDPAFASELRERLRRHERPRILPANPALRVLAAAAAVAVVVVVVATVPSVRVSAQSVLDIFRVKHFAAVEFKESRREVLESMEKDHLMVFDKVETTLDPGPARHVASRAEAGTLAGFSVLAPHYLPDSLAADSVFVQGAGAIRVAASEAKLRALLDRLDLKKVKVPSGLDGQWVEVKKPPMVAQRFQSRERKVVLLQSTSPQVAMPAGWDLAQLGEIGLRILGLDAGEAKRVAKATDWKSTLLVPLPMNASSFRQVTIGRGQGLLINMADKNRDRVGSILLWSEGDRIFCLRGHMNASDLIQMAESIS
jgi:hypothetical protein